MGYAPFYTEDFISDLEALSKPDMGAVLKKLQKIEENPLHFDFLNKSKRTQKARAGNLRIIFRLEGDALKFYRVGKRDAIYREIRGLF